MIIIAKLGGYLHRKCDHPPGFECLWKGYAILDTMVRMMQLCHAVTAKSRPLMCQRKSVGQTQG